MKKQKKSLLVVLFAFIFILSCTVTSFGTQTVEYTTNGAANQYMAGSVLVLYGKVTDGSIAIPNTSVTVDIKDSGSKVIYYGQLKTDSKGYFKTNFTIPSGVAGSMDVKISTNEGEKVNASYSLDSSGESLNFVGYTPHGYMVSEAVATIPASTDLLGLVFNKNVNYYNNKNNNLDLTSLGVIERNKDCVDLYEKNSQGNFILVPSSLQMISSGGDNSVSGITYIPTAIEKKDQRKDVLYVKPTDGLKASTTYKVVMDKDLLANSSSTLGSDVVVYFTTAASSVSSGSGSSGSSGGGTSGPNYAAEPTVKADAVGNITAGQNTASLSVDSTKAEDLLKNEEKKALSIDLSEIRADKGDRVNVTLPAKVLATAKTENKPVILNYGEYLMVIPPGSLPSDQEIVLEAKPGGTPESDNQPKSVTGLKQFEFSAKDSSGNDIAFNSKLDVEFDIPDHTVHPERLCVYFIDDKTGEWIYAGGRIVDGKLAFSPEHYSTYVIAESTKTFTDIGNHWAKDYIETMVARQISKGISDTMFEPNRSITRAEFAALLSRTLKLESENEAPVFSDVSAGAWYQDEVSKAAAAKIVTGNDGKFRPNDSISRQEMAVMLSRAYSYAGAETVTGSAISYSDQSSVSGWARNGVAQVSALKIMSGYPDGTFGPVKNSTRAEATKTLKVFMDTLGL